MTDSNSSPIIIDARYLLADPAEPVLVRDARIVVQADTIVAVGRKADTPAPLTSTLRRFDLVMPGLINAHHHAYARSPAAAGCMDMPLEPWLVALNLLREGGGAHLATLASSVRQLRAGVTAVIHSDGPGPAEIYPRAVEERLTAYAQTGQRVGFALGYADQQSWVYAPDAQFLATLPRGLRHRVAAHMRATAGLSPAGYESLFSAIADSNWIGIGERSTRARLLIGPLSPNWASREALEMMANLLHRYPRSGLHTHFLESIHQRQWADQQFGSRLARYLAKLGLLDQRASLAHGVWASTDDLEVLRETGATVVHNPSSNLRLRSGIAPVLDMREQDVHVALGQDANALDDDDDFLREARLAWRLHFRPGVHGAALTVEDVFAMIYRGGARALGMPGELGVVSTGARADIIGLTLDRTGDPVHADAHGMAEHVLQWMRSQDIRWVMVDGLEVVHDGEVCTVDEAAILKSVHEAHARVFRDNARRDLFERLEERVRVFYTLSSPDVEP